MLVLCICGNDILKKKDQAQVEADINQLVALLPRKARRVLAFMGGSWLMGRAPPEFDDRMERMRRPLREAGLMIALIWH